MNELVVLANAGTYFDVRTVLQCIPAYAGMTP